MNYLLTRENDTIKLIDQKYLAFSFNYVEPENFREIDLFTGNRRDIFEALRVLNELDHEELMESPNLARTVRENWVKWGYELDRETIVELIRVGSNPAAKSEMLEYLGAKHRLLLKNLITALK